MNRWTDDFWMRHLEPARPPAPRGVDWTILLGWVVAIAAPWLVVIVTLAYLFGWPL